MNEEIIEKLISYIDVLEEENCKIRDERDCFSDKNEKLGLEVLRLRLEIERLEAERLDSIKYKGHKKENIPYLKHAEDMREKQRIIASK